MHIYIHIYIYLSKYIYMIIMMMVTTMMAMMTIIYYTFNAYIFVYGRKEVGRTLARVAWESTVYSFSRLLFPMRNRVIQLNQAVELTFNTHTHTHTLLATLVYPLCTRRGVSITVSSVLYECSVRLLNKREEKREPKKKREKKKMKEERINSSVITDAQLLAR